MTKHEYDRAFQRIITRIALSHVGRAALEARVAAIIQIAQTLLPPDNENLLLAVLGLFHEYDEVQRHERASHLLEVPEKLSARDEIIIRHGSMRRNAAPKNQKGAWSVAGHIKDALNKELVAKSFGALTQGAIQKVLLKHPPFRDKTSMKAILERPSRVQ